MFKLAIFLKNYKLECLLGPVFKLFEAILELLLPTMMVFVINNGVAKQDWEYVLHMGGWMLAMSVLGFGCSMVCQYFAARASQGLAPLYVIRCFGISVHCLMKNRFVWHLLVEEQRLINDINQLQLAVAMLIRLVVRTPFICLGAVAMAMMLDLQLSLLLWGAMPVFVLILWLIVRRSSVLYRFYQKRLDEYQDHAQHRLSRNRRSHPYRA